MLQKYDQRNNDIHVNINGKLVPRAEAAISPFDSSVQNGDGVWEGLRLYNGRIFRLEQHLDRLAASARSLAYEGFPSREKIIREIRSTLQANEMHDGVHIRVTVTRGVKYTSGLDPRLNNAGTTLIILAEHKPPVYDRTGLYFKTSSIRRIPPQCLDQKIHSCNQLNSILAKIEANRAEADDALMLDVRGYLAETNATNVFIVSDDTVLTSLTDSCPEGVTRTAVLELCAKHNIAAQVRDISVAEIHAAQEVFCTGTMGEIIGVACIDDTEYLNGRIGPMTQRIAALYSELTASEGFEIC
ncbi:MAG: aminotransferase class IV [Gammaproteobacteria bacterium]|nr:aminotransferase class IV [Gammaproteobacteria bacterium]